MNFARWSFRLGAIYGLIVLLPLFGLERRVGIDTPPAITHPEYFYGFAATTCALQLAYLLIAHDPLRYRPLMPVGAAAKMGFALCCAVLAWQGRLHGLPLAFATVDFLLGMLFLAAYLRCAAVPRAFPRQDRQSGWERCR